MSEPAGCPGRRIDTASGHRVVAMLKEQQRVALVGHKRADGDCVGSMLGLGAFLEAGGGEVHYLLPGGVPKRYGFLLDGRSVGWEAGPVACAVAIDVASPERMEECCSVYESAGLRVVIDHHPSNSVEGEERWVAPAASSVAEMLWQVLREEEVPRATAVGLYVGMMTDTGRFSYSNTAAGTLKAAAELMEAGADGPALFDRIYRARSLSSLLLEACVLNRLELCHEGKLAIACLDHEALAAFNEADSDEMAARMLEVEGVVAGVLLLETEPGAVKIGWRSRGGVDVGRMAGRFGGGGHRGAAGAEVTGDMEEVRSRVLESFEGLVGTEGG